MTLYPLHLQLSLLLLNPFYWASFNPSHRSCLNHIWLYFAPFCTFPCLLTRTLPFSGGSADFTAGCSYISHAVLSMCERKENLIKPSPTLSLLSAPPSPLNTLSLPLPGGSADLPAEGEGGLVQWAAAQLRAAASWFEGARRGDWQAGEPHPWAGAGPAGQRWVPGEG